MKRLFFDNKGSRYAKAVDHFAPLLGFASHSFRLPHKRPKRPTAPYLKGSSMGAGGVLEESPGGYFKYVSLDVCCQNLAARLTPGRKGDAG